GMTFALMLDDDQLGFAGAGRSAAFALFFESDGFAFLDIFVADDTGFLRENRRDVRVPRHKLLARLDLLAVGGGDRGAIGNLVFLDLAALEIDHGDFAVALQSDHALDAFGVLDFDGVDVAMLDRSAGGRLDVVFDERSGGNAAGVERTHSELRAGLTNRLGGDDADCEAFL